MIDHLGAVFGEILTPICDGPVEEVKELTSVHVVHKWWLLHEHDITLPWVSLSLIGNSRVLVEGEGEENDGIKLVFVG